LQHRSRAPRRCTAPPPDELNRILHDLTNLQLGAQPVLGDRTNIEEAVRNAKRKAQEPDSDRQAITISSGSDASDDDTIPPPFMTKKAYRISKLASKVPHATDNSALSNLIAEFVTVLKSNTSRTLTKDGFGFLDALVKQLADPSVFVIPMRYVKSWAVIDKILTFMTAVRTRSKDDQRSAEPANAKLGVVARLRREVGSARTNGRLAQMVQDFGNVTNRSSGRTITKVRRGFH